LADSKAAAMILAGRGSRWRGDKPVSALLASAIVSPRSKPSSASRRRRRVPRCWIQAPDGIFTRLAHRYRAKRARHIWELSQNGEHNFVAVIRRLPARCHLGQCESVY